MQPAPAAAQESTSSPIKALADFTPAELVGLFNETVEAIKPRAITCGYKAWDDKQVPAILSRFKLVPDFTSAVQSYAKILVPSRRATLRDFVQSAPPTRSTGSRPLESLHRANAPVPAKPPKERTAEEILADQTRRERGAAEIAERDRIYDLAKRMLPS